MLKTLLRLHLEIMFAFAKKQNLYDNKQESQILHQGHRIMKKNFSRIKGIMVGLVIQERNRYVKRIT